MSTLEKNGSLDKTQWRIRNDTIQYCVGDRDVSLVLGQPVIFDIDLVTSVSSGSKKKYVVGHDQRDEWFRNRFLNTVGIQPIQFEMAPIFSEIRRKSETFNKPAARFYGLGIVMDDEKAKHAINNGVGQAKTFGFGFLTLEDIK